MYTISPNGFIIQDTPPQCIPPDADNVDYQAYLSWVAAGNVAAVDSSQVIAQQLSSLDSTTKATIESGYTSLALGDVFTYGSLIVDQNNLTASVLASLLTNDPAWTTYFMCADKEGNWAYRPHTAKQIQQVGLDLYAAILGVRMETQAKRDKIIKNKV